MSKFRYSAFDPAGVVASGEIEAATMAAAVDALRRRDLLPYETVEVGATATLPWWRRELFSSGSLNRRELAFFIRELAALSRAQIPLDDALRSLTGEMASVRGRRTAAALLADVVAGASLSEAMARQRRTFSAFIVSMVRAGEASGKLGTVIEEIAGFLERAVELRARLGQALVYPLMLLVLAAAAITLIVTVLLPSLLPLFTESGAEPPLLIATLTWLSNAIASSWPTLLVALMLLAVGIAAVVVSPSGRRSLDRLILRLPVAGPLAASRDAARIGRSLATLSKSGVPLVDALGMLPDIAGNRAIADALSAAQSRVRNGAPLSEPLRQAGIFPPVFLQLLKLGEETGQLAPMLDHAAQLMETRLSRSLDRLLGLLTPVLTVGIGLVVGGLLVSVVNAILSVNELALR